MKPWLVLAILMLAPSFPVVADVDESAYMAGNAVRGERARHRLQEQLAAEAEAERLRALAVAAAEAEARAAALAREAARPYSERLTEAECTRCHAATNYAQARHTWLGWRLVVARMVWLNEAPLALAEQSVIAGHLAAAYPASREEWLIEYGAAAGALGTAGIIIGGAGYWWRRSRKRRQVHDGKTH